jgi:hypothetical protein
MLESESIMYSKLHIYWQRWRYHWRCCTRILFLLHTQKDLRQLARWAKRKRYAHSYRGYTRRLQQLEQLLSTLSMRYPIQTRWAHRLLWLNHLVSSRQRYYRGHAARYK